MVEIKLGTEDEIATAHQLMREAFEEYRTLEVPSSAISEPIELLRESFKNGTEQFIVGYENGIPLGSSRFIMKEESLYFSRVSVPPHARGRGIAKSMILWLEDFAKNEGKSKLECKVRAALSNNVRLYESMGFVITEEETTINPNGFQVKAVVMEKEI